MIIAITGGTGFIGGKLVSRLIDRGDTIRLLARSSRTVEKTSLVRIFACDLVRVGISELSSFLEGVDVLYHCAGELKNTGIMRALHVEATHKLAEAASHRVGHWVQLSSVGVYGPVTRGAITEDSALNPIGEYQRTKAESENIIKSAANGGGFTYSIVRPSNVFGAGMTNQSLYSMISMIARRLFFYIGKPGASANYIHVNNVVEGLISCGTLQEARGRTYNLSDHCSLEHFIEIISNSLGHGRTVWRCRIPEPVAYLAGTLFGKIPGFPLTLSRIDMLTNHSVYPMSRIQKELGYSHSISMEDGLKELVEQYKKDSGWELVNNVRVV